MGMLFHFRHRVRRRPARLLFLLPSLGVAFGFIAVIFAAGHATYFRLPNGVAEQDYVSLGRRTESGQFLGLSLSDLEAIDEMAPEISWFYAEPLPNLRLLDRSGSKRPLQARNVSNDYFAALDVAVRQGRASPPGPYDPAVVVSDSLWRVLQDADGGTGEEFLYMEGDVLLPIVGVAPSTFAGLFGKPVEAWIFNPPANLGRYHELLPTTQEVRRRVPTKRVFGVPDPSTSMAALQLRLAEYRFETGLITVAEPRLQHPISISLGVSDSDRLKIVDGLETAPEKRSEIGRRLVWLAGIGLLLLALAHTSVVDFLMAQNAARQQEQRIRIAVGATPVDLFTEAATRNLLWTAGVAAIAWGSFDYLYDVLIRFEPFRGYLGKNAAAPNPIGLIVSVGLLAATFLLAVAQASRFNLKTFRTLAWSATQSKISASPATRRLLLFIATFSLLFVFSLVNRYLGDARFSLEFRNTNAMIVSVSSGDLSGWAEGTTQQRIRNAIASVSTVQSAAQASMMPLAENFQGNHHDVTVAGDTQLADKRLYTNRVTPDYFRTLGVKLLAGRTFAEEAKNEIVLARSTAQMLADAIEQSLGMTLAMLPTRGEASPSKASSRANSAKVVVGVVEDISYGHYSEQQRPIIYENAADDRSGADWIVHYNGAPADIVDSLERAGFAANQMVRLVGTPASLLQEQFAAKRNVEILLAGAAAFALMLALAGTATSLARTIAEERRRIGISLALGATNLDLFRPYMGNSARDLLLALLALCVLVLIVKALAPLSMFILELWLIAPVTICVMSICALLVYMLIRRLAKQGSISQLIH